MRQITRTARLLTPLAAVMLLAACGGAEEEDVAYEADVEDLSGGELIVTDAEDPAIPVDLPETEMTPVIEGDAPDKPVSNTPADAVVDKAPPK